MTTTHKPTAATFREWAASHNLPVPADVVIVPLHGDSAGRYQVSTFDFSCQYNYPARVAYLHKLVEQGGRVVEETAKKVTVEVDLNKQLEPV